MDLTGPRLPTTGLTLLLAGAALAPAQVQIGTDQPQLGKSSTKDVVAALTPEEKVRLVVGTGTSFAGLPPEMQGPAVGETQGGVPGAAGQTFAIPRLGIPAMVVADGPAGLRIQPLRDGDSSKTYHCIAFLAHAARLHLGPGARRARGRRGSGLRRRPAASRPRSAST